MVWNQPYTISEFYLYPPLAFCHFLEETSTPLSGLQDRSNGPCFPLASLGAPCICSDQADWIAPSTGLAPSVYNPFPVCFSVTCHSGTTCPLFCPPQTLRESELGLLSSVAPVASRGPGMRYSSFTVTGMHSGHQSPRATELWVTDVA